MFHNHIPRVSLAVGVLLWGHGQALAAEVKAYPECTTEPAESDVAAAKGAFQAGQASFNEADYARAITYWEDAFRRDCTASALLLNLARAYELSENRPQAVEALQTYLARNPETAQKDKTQITRRIEVLNRQIEEDEKKKAAATVPAPSSQPASQGTTPAAPTAPATPAEQKPPSNSYWIGPVILGGAGLAMTTVGPFVMISGSSDEKKAEDQCPTRKGCTKRVEQLGNDGIFKQKVGVGLIAGGVAAMGGALLWYLMARPDATASAAAPGPAAAPTPAKGGAPAPATPTPQQKPTPQPAPAAPASSAETSTLLVPVFGEGYSGISLLGTF